MQVEGIRYFRVESVAEMFDVSKSTIYRAIRAGKLEAAKVGGALRVSVSALRLFTDACTEAGYQAYVRGGESPEDDDSRPTPALVAGAVSR